MVLALFLAPGLAMAATPSEGVALEVRRGFFTETDVGVFFTLGGDNQYSNAQTYLQLGVGYDLTENIALGVHFGIGANAQNCWSGPGPRGDDCLMGSNFTMAFLDVTAAYLFPVVDRFYIAPKIAAGYTLLDPEPVAGFTGGANIGGGIGFEYATHMDHFTIGADALVRYVVGPNIPAISIFPRVKYTF
ncbi:MAG: adventurous gliding motility protein CglE [Myxococcaceae bacterium]